MFAGLTVVCFVGCAFVWVRRFGLKWLFNSVVTWLSWFACFACGEVDVLWFDMCLLFWMFFDLVLLFGCLQFVRVTAYFLCAGGFVMVVLCRFCVGLAVLGLRLVFCIV